MMEFREFATDGPAAGTDGEIDPRLEASALSVRDQRSPWHARARGSPGFRLAGNVFSTRERIARALGVSVEGIPERILEAMNGPVPPEEIPVPEQYHEVAPGDLPIPFYYEGDGGPYITSAIFHASYGGKGNLSFHRMMHLGEGSFAIRVVPRHLNALMKEARAHGEDLEVVVSIGCDIASLIAASCSVGYGADEMGIASHLVKRANGSPLKVFRPGKNGPLAPLGAEIVLDGRITDENVPEGPFVDITGTRDLSGMGGQPVFVAERVLARDDPIMHVLLPGGLEHFLLMGLPKEPSILQSVRKVVPQVHAVRLTEGGCSWLHGVVSITPQKTGDSKNAILAALAGHPSMKRVIVVDGDIDIFDDRAVEWAVATRFQAHRDLVVVHGARGSTLDPSLDADGTTSKYGIDATMPPGGREDFRRVVL